MVYIQSIIEQSIIKTTNTMSHNNTNRYAERIQLEDNRYETFTKNRWNIEFTLSKVNSIYNELNKENIFANKDNDSCSICMNTMLNKTVVQTKCGHSFCFDCITKNRKHNKYTGEQCGICRANIFEN